MFPENNNSSGGHNHGNQNHQPNSNNNRNSSTSQHPDITETATALLSLNIPLQDLPLPIQHPPQPATTPNIPHPDFYRIQTHLSRPLVPLVSITTGLPHPSFPSTILQYNLLTSTQLDDLAIHYHQTRPLTRQTFQYPIRVPSWVGEDVPIETKRRRLGRFIGLRGCESPTSARGEGEEAFGLGMETEEEMLARMEREWEEALRRARSEDDERLLRWKAGGI